MLINFRLKSLAKKRPPEKDAGPSSSLETLPLQNYKAGPPAIKIGEIFSNYDDR